MFEWLSKSIPCCGSRAKGEKLIEKVPDELIIQKCFDISTMFPSVQANNFLEKTEIQPDSEHMYESQTKSSPSDASLSFSNEISKEELEMENITDEEINSISCKVCKKEAEGFCCACKTEKFCNKCFKEFHVNLPRFHVYFNFKAKSAETSSLYRQGTFHRRLSKLAE